MSSHVATWVAAVNPDGDMEKWGPFEPTETRLIADKSFAISRDRPRDHVFLLHVFADGDLRHFNVHRQEPLAWER